MKKDFLLTKFNKRQHLKTLGDMNVIWKKKIVLE